MQPMEALLDRVRRIARDPWQVTRAVTWWPDYYAFKRQVRPLREDLRADAEEAAQPTALIVSLTNWVAQVKVECLLAAALKGQGWRPRILTYRRCTRAHKYFRAFGLRDFVWLDEYQAPPSADAHAVARALLDQARTVQQLKEVSYRGVLIGRQVLASLSRSAYRNVDLSDPSFRQGLAVQLPSAIASVDAADRLLAAVAPRLAIFLDKDYAGIGSIYDRALDRGVDVIQWCGSQRDDAYTLKRYTRETRTENPQSLDPATWRLVREAPWSAARDRELDEELRRRYTGEGAVSYYNTPAGRPEAAAPVRARLGLDPSKKTAIIFSHILWDSTFFWGEDLFDDYAQWLVETVRAAVANPALQWVVKLHPANRWKMEREGARGELHDLRLLREQVGPLPPHVTVLDPDVDVNTGSLFAVADYCLTVRGSVGIEMACHGVPVVTAGTGRYVGLGFTVDSSSRAEYLARLSRLQEMPRMAPAEVELARRYAYGLWLVRPWRFSTFGQVFLPVRRGGHPLDHNVVFQGRTLRDLAQAPDLQAFARWACHARTADYSDEQTVAQLQGRG